MAKEILKCVKCDSYTLEKVHCGGKTISIKPARYSLDDKFGVWRRKYKQNEMAHK